MLFLQLEKNLFNISIITFSRVLVNVWYIIEVSGYCHNNFINFIGVYILKRNNWFIFDQDISLLWNQFPDIQATSRNRDCNKL